MRDETVADSSCDDNPALDVLVIDDSSVHARMTLDAICRIAPGLRAMHFEDATHALQFILDPLPSRRFVAAPRLILLEIGNPFYQGLRILNRLCSSPHAQPAPVVVLSSVSDAAAIDSSYMLGASAFVVKPEQMEEYSAAIASIIKRWMLKPRIAVSARTLMSRRDRYRR